ncbi:MAG: glycosyltransferase family 4 protein [Rhodospirillales bacterium]
MRIWMHFPMKPLHHPRPSGDVVVARLLRNALRAGGHVAHTAHPFTSYDNTGDPARQANIKEQADSILAGLIETAGRGNLPDAWFTYHLYHKAPDFLGPGFCNAFNIPYAVAEASRAMKQQGGPWARGYAACDIALARADVVFNINPADAAGVRPVMRADAAMVTLPPFVDMAPYAKARAERDASRAALARAHGLDPAQPWLAAAAMMRAGDKAASYAALAEALADVPFPLLIAGKGRARAEVEAMFANRAAPTVFLGLLTRKNMTSFYAACDLLVWPAVNEAYGMVFLEAQAAGCPVVAGNAGGVSGIVQDGGVLVPEGDAAAVRDAVNKLLAAPEKLAAMRAKAVRAVEARHTLAHGGEVLTAGLEQACKVRRAATPPHILV